MPRTEDGSVISPNGKLMFCSPERFLRDICAGKHCLICGRNEAAASFNREHVFPDWLLRQFSLHSGSITLPNQGRHAYGTYTVPCCTECNGGMSDVFETPISRAFASGFNGVEALIAREGTGRLFEWLTLIFLKIHFKDRLLRKYADFRKGDAPISENYEWQYFHHIHCLSRAHYTGAEVDPSVYGSLLLVQLIPEEDEEAFDLATFSDASTIFLRAGDIAMFAVLNDGKACLGAIEPILDRITGPVRSLQAREIAAELAAAKLHMENPPRFETGMDDLDGTKLRIMTHQDPQGPKFLEKDAAVVGAVKLFAFQAYLDNVHNYSREEAAAALAANRLSFLFDDEGEFMKNPYTPPDR